jgi:uncharacterized membrane protein YdjX (TVP38/TMEM64 family)
MLASMEPTTTGTAALLPDARTVRRKLLAGAAVLAVVLVAARLLRADLHLAALADLARQQGALGVLLHAVAFVVAALLGLPAAPLIVAAGLSYGPLGGAAIAVPANVLGASVAFAAGRRLMADRGALERLPGPVARAARAIGEGGFKLVLVLRLVPVAPWSVLNYAFGAAPGRFSHFVAGSLLGSVPNALAYAWAGAVLGG